MEFVRFVVESVLIANIKRVYIRRMALAHENQNIMRRCIALQDCGVEKQNIYDLF